MSRYNSYLADLWVSHDTIAIQLTLGVSRHNRYSTDLLGESQHDTIAIQLTFRGSHDTFAILLTFRGGGGVQTQLTFKLSKELVSWLLLFNAEPTSTVASRRVKQGKKIQMAIVVCWFLAYRLSNMLVYICSHNFTCRHTEIEATDQIFDLTVYLHRADQSQH